VQQIPAHVSAFRSWLESSARAGAVVDPGIVEIILRLHRDYQDPSDPGSWGRGQLSEILLSLIPRSVSAPPAWVRCVVPTAQAWLDFLAETGRRTGVPLATLREELAESAPHVEMAMSGPGNWGAADPDPRRDRPV
jgi:hypothetical protein